MSPCAAVWVVDSSWLTARAYTPEVRSRISIAGSVPFDLPTSALTSYASILSKNQRRVAEIELVATRGRQEVYCHRHAGPLLELLLSQSQCLNGMDTPHFATEVGQASWLLPPTRPPINTLAK